MFGQPLQVEPDELLESESLHVVVVDDVDAEVQQVFAVFYLCGNQRTDVQLQLIEHRFVHDAVAVYQMLEQSVFLDGGEVFVRHFDAACAACIGLYGVHVFLSLKVDNLYFDCSKDSVFVIYSAIWGRFSYKKRMLLTVGDREQHYSFLVSDTDFIFWYNFYSVDVE